MFEDQSVVAVLSAQYKLTRKEWIRRSFGKRLQILAQEISDFLCGNKVPRKLPSKMKKIKTKNKKVKFEPRFFFKKPMSKMQIRIQTRKRSKFKAKKLTS